MNQILNLNNIISILQNNNISFQINVDYEQQGIISIPKYFQLNIESIQLDNLIIKILDDDFIHLFLADPNIKIQYTLDIILNQKYLIESGSVNPTGFLHVGHMRNILISDFIIKLLRLFSYNRNDIHTQYYVNDGGSQIQSLKNNEYYNISFFDLQNDMSGVNYFNEINKLALSSHSYIWDEWLYQSKIYNDVRDEEIFEYMKAYLYYDKNNKPYLKHSKSRKIYLKNKYDEDSYFMADLKLYLYRQKMYPHHQIYMILSGDQEELINNLKYFVPNIQYIILGNVLYKSKSLSKRNQYVFNHLDLKYSLSSLKLIYLKNKSLNHIDLINYQSQNMNKLSNKLKKFLYRPFICQNDNKFQLIFTKISLIVIKILNSFDNYSQLVVDIISLVTKIGLSRKYLHNNILILKIISCII